MYGKRETDHLIVWLHVMLLTQTWMPLGYTTIDEEKCIVKVSTSNFQNSIIKI